MTDTFRKVYKKLTDDQAQSIADIKIKAEELESLINYVSSCIETSDKRCLALAKTNLEQSIMWAIKAIT